MNVKIRILLIQMIFIFSISSLLINNSILSNTSNNSNSSNTLNSNNTFIESPEEKVEVNSINILPNNLPASNNSTISTNSNIIDSNSNQTVKINIKPDDEKKIDINNTNNTANTTNIENITNTTIIENTTNTTIIENATNTTNATNARNVRNVRNPTNPTNATKTTKTTNATIPKVETKNSEESIIDIKTNITITEDKFINKTEENSEKDENRTSDIKVSNNTNSTNIISANNTSKVTNIRETKINITNVKDTSSTNKPTNITNNIIQNNTIPNVNNFTDNKPSLNTKSKITMNNTNLFNLGNNTVLEALKNVEKNNVTNEHNYLNSIEEIKVNNSIISGNNSDTPVKTVDFNSFSDEDLRKQIDEVYEPSDEAINYKDYENYSDTKNDIEVESDKVNDFDPQDISTVLIPKQSSHKIFVYIAKATKINYAFIELSEKVINFKFISPSGDILIEKDEINEINDFDIKEKGLYVFKFKNSMSQSSKITFAYDPGYIDEEKKIISNENIRQIFDKIKKPKKHAKKLNNMSSTFHLKYINHLVEAKKHNKSIIVFSLIECAVMIMVFYFQTKFMISLMDKV